MKTSNGIYQRLITGRYYYLEISDCGYYIATPWSIKNKRRRKGIEYGWSGKFNSLEWNFIEEREVKHADNT
jgi:hypothetical protein